MFQELVLKNRSYRRFYEEEAISMETLTQLAGLGRIVPSTANSQSTKMMLVNSVEEKSKVFSCLGWAGMLKDWPGPEVGERPSAYIVLLGDISLGKSKPIDVGIIAQTILLGAVSEGLGGCMLSNVNRPQLADLLSVDLNKYTIDLVIALGKPKEQVVLEDMTDSQDHRYYRDSDGTHHVPKRPLEALIVHKSH